MEKIDINALKEKFNGLNFKEVHTWPISVQALMGVGVTLGILVFGTLFFIKPQADSLTTAQNKEKKLKEEFLDKKKQAVNLTLYKNQLEEITKASDALLKQFPVRSEIEKLLIDINQAGIARGLNFELFKPEQEKIMESYAELPIKIKIVGTYDALGNFTADLGQLSRVVILSDMNVTLVNPANGITATSQLVLEGTAKTFRYLEPEEIEKIKAEEEKKKKNQKKKVPTTPPKAQKGEEKK